MLCTIVGAGQGLGAAIGARFAREGFDIALLARDERRLASVVARGDLASRGRAFRCDAADPAAIASALDDVRAWRGDTDVLIYNAAQMTPDDASRLDSSALLAAMRVDVGGALDCLQHVLPAMRSRGAGTVLLTGGGLALEPYPGWASLGAGKAALRSLAIGLHKELAPLGVHVAVIAVCGVVTAGGPFDPDTIAELYWQVHSEPMETARREVVYLPPGADPFYNDADGTYRSTSRPIMPPDA